MAKTNTPKLADIHAANIGILKDKIKKGNISGCYVFYGDEEYTKNHYYDVLCQSCGDKSLNVKTISGAEFNYKDFINACDTNAVNVCDLFSSDKEDDSAYRLIRLISPKLSALSKKEEQLFLQRIEDPDEGVIILFWMHAGSTEDMSKGIYKTISESALTVNFKHEPLGSPTLTAWVIRHFHHERIEVERSTAMYMINYVGCDMTTLKNEIDSCVNYLRYENRDTVTKDDIEFVCKKSEEAQIFDISEYALSGNYARAIASLNILYNSAKSKDKVVNAVYGVINRAVYDLCSVYKLANAGENVSSISEKTGMKSYPVTKNLEILRKRRDFSANGLSYTRFASQICLEYDALSKNSKTDKFALLKELVFKLSLGIQVH